MTKLETTTYCKDAMGNIPERWRLVHLGEVCELRTGGTPSKSDAANFGGEIKWLVSGDVHLGEIFDCAGRITKTGVVNSNARLLPPDCVLIALNGQGKTRGTVALLRVDAACNQSLVAMIPKKRDELLSRFLLYQLQMRYQELRNLTGDSHRSGLSMGILSNLVIALPSFDEQCRIAGLLCAQKELVEKASSAAQARIETIQQLPPSYYRQVFGESLPFAASPLTPTKPTQPGWNWHRLTHLARLATGHTPSRYHPEFWKGEVPWIQLADIRALDGQEVFDTSEHTNDIGIENSAAVLLPKGTVCMSRTASVGFVAIMGRIMATSQDFVNWVCGTELDPWFLMHLLIACRKPIRELGSGAVHDTIYFPTVEAFSVCLPSLSEQRRIVEMLHGQLTAVAKALAAAKKELQTISVLPAALLRHAFSGEI